MENIFFFQTQQIHDNTNLFDQLKKQNIFYSYFQVDQNYYLFVYSQNSIDINFLYQSIDVIEELDSKQRKIRSFRGFSLYALEIIEKGKDYEILTTNLQPFFWRKVKTIIRQNQKGALLEFLFGEYANRKTENKGSEMEKKMETLQNQVNFLEQKIIQLEHNQNIVRERNLNVVSGGSKMDFKASSKPQQDNISSDQSKAQNQSNFSN